MELCFALLYTPVCHDGSRHVFTMLLFLCDQSFIYFFCCVVQLSFPETKIGKDNTLNLSE